jgi:hypothetical protein
MSWPVQRCLLWRLEFQWDNSRNIAFAGFPVQFSKSNPLDPNNLAAISVPNDAVFGGLVQCFQRAFYKNAL